MHVCEPTSAPSEARLSAVHQRDGKRRRDRLVHIGVIEKDVRRLTAEFKRDTLHCRGAVAHDRLADSNRACERSLSHIRIADDLRPDDIAAPNDHVVKALRELCLDQPFIGEAPRPRRRETKS